MNLVWNLVVALQIIAALVMIGLVLIQHGKGADMGASFGSGASGSLFGASGSANFLSRSTAVCAGIFFLATLALAFLANTGGAARNPAADASVLDRAPLAASAPAAPASVGGVIPGAAPSPAAAPATAPAAPSAASAAPAAASVAAGTIPSK